MRLTLTILATLVGLVSPVFAQDGPSGDGECDPCDETCPVFSKRDLSKIPRMVEYNDTSEWEEGEIARWRKPANDFDPTAPGPPKPAGRYEKREAETFSLVFNCANVPEICLNICYGVNCGKYLPTTLTINRSACPAARKSNNCGTHNPNYCSTKSGFPAGYSCDEYPFASTTEGLNYGRAGRAATRCVPRAQNSAQGSIISGLYRNGQGTGRLADGTQFNIGLVGPALGYCNPTPNCNTRFGDTNSAGSQR